MRSRVSLIKYIIYCILESMMVIVLNLAFMGYMAFKMNFWVTAAIAAGSNILMYILVSYPVTGISAGIIIPAVSFAFYISKKKLFLKYAGIAWGIIKGTAVWFYDYMFNPSAKIEKLYSIIIIVCFIVLCTIIIYLLVTMAQKTVLAMAAGVVYLSFLWFFGYDDAFKYLQLFLFVCFLTFGFVQYNVKETVWKLKQGIFTGKTTASWMICTVVSTLLVFFAINFLPIEFKPVNIQWINDNVSTWIDDFNLRDTGFTSGGNSRLFSISTLGFQENPSKLGGPVKLSDKLLLKVKIDGDMKAPYYLRGTVKDMYTGSYWKKSTSDSKKVNTGQEISSLIGDDSRIKEYKDVVATIYPQSINTVSIFNLWKPYKIEINTDSYSFDGSGDITSSLSRAKNKVYIVSSKAPVIYSDEFSSNERRRGNRPYSESFYPYLELPDNLPDRVKSLAVNITEKYSKDFQKAEAIQDYLRANFPYTLETSSVPDGRDFVDYFLFDEKKGYCTYYASAMAVMSRVAGIPSRYVEGFIIEDKDLGTDGMYNVTAAKAHAWVELYFDGYGWIKFEPTAGYMAADYERPKEKEEQPVVTPAGETPENIPAPEINRRNRAEEEEQMGAGGAANTKKPVLVYIIIAAALILVVRVVSKLYDYMKDIKKADRMDGKEAAIEYYYMIDKWLKHSGIERYPGETPGEFGQRVDQQIESYDFKGQDVKMSEIADIFNRTRFGKEKMDDNERTKFKQAIKIADKYFKYRKGILKYLAIKYML